MGECRQGRGAVPGLLFLWRPQEPQPPWLIWAPLPKLGLILLPGGVSLHSLTRGQAWPQARGCQELLRDSKPQGAQTVQVGIPVPKAVPARPFLKPSPGSPGGI